MTYVYIKSESNPDLYTVGHWSPDGRWWTDSDHSDREDAARRVAWLNGSAVASPFEPLTEETAP